MSDYQSRVKSLLDKAISHLEQVTTDWEKPATVKNLEILTKIVVLTDTWGTADETKGMSNEDLRKALMSEE